MRSPSRSLNETHPRGTRNWNPRRLSQRSRMQVRLPTDLQPRGTRLWNPSRLRHLSRLTSSSRHPRNPPKRSQSSKSPQPRNRSKRQSSRSLSPRGRPSGSPTGRSPPGRSPRSPPGRPNRSPSGASSPIAVWLPSSTAAAAAGCVNATIEIPIQPTSRINSRGRGLALSAQCMVIASLARVERAALNGLPRNNVVPGLGETVGTMRSRK